MKNAESTTQQEPNHQLMKKFQHIFKFNLKNAFPPRGSSAFSFYCPEKDIYLTGTVNQAAYPDLSYKLMVKMINYL